MAIRLVPVKEKTKEFLPWGNIDQHWLGQIELRSLHVEPFNQTRQPDVSGIYSCTLAPRETLPVSGNVISNMVDTSSVY